MRGKMRKGSGVNQRRAGAVLSYVALVVNAVTTFIYTPLILSFLTTSEYGVYQLIGSIIAYLGVMDMGLSTTLSRFYVEARVKEGKAHVENLLAMAAVIYSVLTALSVVVGIAFDLLLPMLFGQSFTPGELELAHQMMLLVLLNCVVVLPGNYFLAVINANERFIFARTLRIARYLLQFAGVIAVLCLGQGAIGVLAVQVALNFLADVAYVAYYRGRFHVKARLHHWDKRLLLHIFSFSGYILLNMVFDQIFWKTGQVVLGAVVSAAAVGVYGIATQLITSGYMGVSTGVTSVFLPKLTAMSARTDDMTEINGLFDRIGHIQALLVWGICAGFACIGQEFIYVWAGPEYGEAFWATLILMLGLNVSLVQNLGISVLQAKDKQGFRAIIYIVIAVLDLLVSIPVSAEFGVIGCAVTAAVFLFIGTGPIMNWYYHTKIGIDIPKFWHEVIPVLIPAVLTASATLGFSALTRLGPSYGSILIKCLFFVVVYFALCWKWFFTDYERGIIRGTFHKCSRKKA